MRFLKPTETPQPEEVRTLHHSTISIGRFGKAETEMAAGRLLEYLKYRVQGWKPFTIYGLCQFYVANGWELDDVLFGLFGPWEDETGIIDPPTYFVNRGKDLAITDLFLERIK